ncbi:hypothetical protein [Pseudoalteromonas sp. GB56]
MLPSYKAATDIGKVKFIQSKSLPRSGHHFLISMLTKYFGEEAHYCEAHNPENCCKTNPCKKPFNAQVNNKYMIQKSHDFKLSDDKSPSATYIVQHRSPMTRIQSNFELALKSSNGVYTDTFDSFKKFAIKDAKYSVEFYNKWFDPNDGLNKVFVLYDNLVDDTESELTRIVEGITQDKAEPARIELALEGKGVKVNTLNSPTGIRKSDGHRYFDEELYKKVEGIIAKGVKHEIDIPFEFNGK